MIRQLRRSFVRVTMLSAAAVLITLMSLVNVLNYVQRDSADRAILAVLADNDGHLPTDGKGPKFGRFPNLTAQEVYAASYYTVSLSADGTVLFVNTNQAPWVTGEEAVAAAQALQAAGKTDGNTGEMKYTSTLRGTDVMYIFLVWSQNMASVRSFIQNSVLVTLLGLTVLFGLAWLLSGRAVRPIAESYEKQKSFITNAGHELKTPLAVIESSADVIEIESGESKWTRSIHNQVQRLASLTQDLVALARMDENTQKPVLEELDVSAIVSETLEPYALLAEQRGLRLTARIETGLRARSHRDSLVKLCTILADNAVKYTAPEGDILFTLTREGHSIVLREENPAESLSKGRQEQLFDRFYRGDESRSSSTPGYGLGLPLARSLAESLGGSVRADSPDGKRIVFTVRL